MATPSVQNSEPSVESMTLPDTGDVMCKIGYSAVIIGGMTNCVEPLLDDLMSRLMRFHKAAAEDCHGEFEAIHVCLSVIRDHVSTIRELV